MSDTSSTDNGGVGLAGLLFVLFTGLKLGHVIDWSWWWVTSPLWISVSVASILLGLASILMAWGGE
jgi:hypothetical protein